MIDNEVCRVSTNVVIPVELANAFKSQLEAVQATARKIMTIERLKLDDSGDKFIHIRACRIDHAAREVKANKSLRS